MQSVEKGIETALTRTKTVVNGLHQGGKDHTNQSDSTFLFRKGESWEVD